MTILSWCKDPEEGALEQAKNLEKHPWLVGNVCLMPDTHEGYGMPIGGVVALDNAVSPNMVGVDIGCGMYAVKTTHKAEDIPKETLIKIVNSIKDKIPVGFKHQKEKQKHRLFRGPMWDNYNICSKEFESAQYQLGTLGGGNHFIELQKDEEGFLWFMIHSGSRNLGKKVADYYNKKAEEYCKAFKLHDLIKQQLCVLPEIVPEFTDYLLEMTTCLMFSNANREVMGDRIKESLLEYLPDISFEEPINIQHNYAALEHHYGRDVYVHRKGATLAREGTIGIIPGSQGSCSYIVKGKGNKASLCSCSHGAGRRMSRIKARKELILEHEQSLLDSQGIIHSIRDVQDLDEAASAYKNIDEVMEQQKDLVDILYKLTPLAVVKG